MSTQPRKYLTYCYHRGEIVPFRQANLHADTEAFKFGNVVLDQSIACWSNAESQLYVFRLKDHCQRLWESMRITKMSGVYTPEKFEQAALELLEANQVKRRDICVRFIIYHGKPEDGPKSIGFTIYNYELPNESFRKELRPKKVCVSSWTKLPDHVMPPRANSSGKHANTRYAIQEASARGFDDAIMLNWHGKVSEYTNACAFFMRKGKIFTPNITSDILESITRDTCIQLHKDNGTDVEEREVDFSELYILDEAWQGDTISGLTPVVSIDNVPVGNGKPGPIFNMLREIFVSAHLKQSKIHPEWCSPAYK